MNCTVRFWECWRKKDIYIAEWERQLALPGIRPSGFAWQYVCVLVYERDHGSCRVCEQPDCTPLEVHHIIPLKDGGNSLPENLMLTGSPCHKKLHAGEERLDAYDPRQTKLDWYSPDGLTDD